MAHRLRTVLSQPRLSWTHTRAPRRRRSCHSSAHFPSTLAVAGLFRVGALTVTRRTHRRSAHGRPVTHTPPGRHPPRPLRQGVWIPQFAKQAQCRTPPRRSPDVATRSGGCAARLAAPPKCPAARQSRLGRARHAWVLDDTCLGSLATTRESGRIPFDPNPAAGFGIGHHSLPNLATPAPVRALPLAPCCDRHEHRQTNELSVAQEERSQSRQTIRCVVGGSRSVEPFFSVSGGRRGMRRPY